MKKYALIIHGGCGAVNLFSKAEQKAFLKSLKIIVTAGERLLKKGVAALEVVEAVVKMLEDDPLFNAGRGSVLNSEGKIEMDASIMDGITLKAGAVAGVTSAKNPIEAARWVMEHTPHVLFSGIGANQLVKKAGIAEKPVNYFITGYRKQQLKEAQKKAEVNLDHSSHKLGTVGAVAFDKFGNLAAATSTGGMTNKPVGRVGDSPLIGSGTYADNQTCAVSCTGRGEDFIRASLAKYLSDSIRWNGWSAPRAAKEAIRYFHDKVNGFGGFIIIDRKGKIAEAYTTPGLIRASVIEGGKPVCKLFE